MTTAISHQYILIDISDEYIGIAEQRIASAKAVVLNTIRYANQPVSAIFSKSCLELALKYSL